MRFQVPQFIDVEDHIFGPFTFKQFVYMAGGVGICFVLLRILPRFLAIIAIIPTASFALALAFYKINNKPFVQMVESFFKYVASPRLYLWKRAEHQANRPSPLAESYRQMQVPKLQGSKLKDLTWNLDVRKNEATEE